MIKLNKKFILGTLLILVGFGMNAQAVIKLDYLTQKCTPTYSSDPRTVCDSLTWINGITYYADNFTAQDTLINASGCDSIITLDLAVNYSSASTDIQSSCDSLTWIDGNTYYSDNNSATYTLTNATGCDSVVILNLTIFNSASSIDNRTACDSLTWINGITYTSNNNNAKDTIFGGAANGCDSVVTLNLTILNTTYSTDTIVDCNSHIWIDGNNYFSSNNTATYTLTNTAGCDSIVTLNLTILNSSSSTDSITACDSYTWIDNNTYTTSNNVATYNLINAVGCDSVIHLNLTINYSSNITDTIVSCDSLTWIDGNTYYASNNSAKVTYTNSAGCDSIVNLNLTILNSPNTVDVQSACGSYTWVNGNTYYADNFTAIDTIFGGAFNGCDSVVTLNLTITTIDTSITQINDTLTSNQNGATYQWIDCNNGNTFINGETNQSFATAHTGGNYAVIISYNGCVDTSNCINAGGVGIDEFTQINFSVYPNPIKENFTVILLGKPKNMQISVISVDGKLVYNKINLNNQKLTINTSNWSSGIYFLSVRNDKYSNMVKIIKL